MRVCVTGHEGYIGSVLTRMLLGAGHDVTGIDAGYYSQTYLRGYEPPALPAERTRRVDIRDIEASDLEGIDAVIHLAALCNDPVGDLDADWTYDINHRASVRLAHLARDAGVQRFVLSSSCSLYGDAGTEEELTENTTPHPLTPYAASKAQSEEDISALAGDGFTPVYLRNGSVYGLSPRLRADIVLNNLVCWAVTTGEVVMYTDGSPWRPLVHVEDVSRVFMAMLDAPRETVHNQVFNVGRSAENYQVRQLAAIVSETVAGSRVTLVPHAGGDTRDYRVSFAKLEAALPDLELAWTAQRGAAEVRDGLQAAAVTSDQFQGPDFTRLARLKELIDGGAVDGTLRMRSLEEAAHQSSP